MSRYYPPIPDFDFITPRLAVGSRINNGGLKFTKSKGVTHLLAADEHPEPHVAAMWGITVIGHPFEDDFKEKPVALLHRIAADAVEALQQPDAVLLVTCGAGMHRAPMMAELVLRLMGLTADEAQELVGARRVGAVAPQIYRNSVERALLEWNGPTLPRYEAQGEQTR